MNTIEKLIEQANQEEIDRQQAALLSRDFEREEIFEKCQEVARNIGTILGPAWEEIRSFMLEEYNEYGKVSYQLMEKEALLLEMTPFEVYSLGDGIHFANSRIGNRVVRNQTEFAHFLWVFRKDYPAWNEERSVKIRLQELKKIYEYDLIAWKKEYEQIIAANKVAIEAAQKNIPTFEIYDLEFAVVIRGEENCTLTFHEWILNRDPDEYGYYLVISEWGNLTKKIFFNPVSVSAEAVIIEPGPQNCRFCRSYNLLSGGCIYYGPNLDIEKYLPVVVEPPAMPAPPDGLPDYDRFEVEQKVDVP